jgi:hypothetical protein
MCYCLVEEHWQHDDFDESAFCEGQFFIRAETADGLSAIVEYEQAYQEPHEPVGLNIGPIDCGCNVVR